MTDAALLWSTIYGQHPGMLALFAGRRTGPGQDTKGRLTSPRTTFFRYPNEAAEAVRWSFAASEQDFESYFCAHLLTACRRNKEAAARVLTLWADADGPVPADAPEPTAVVESSPGHAHLFWRLRRPPLPRRRRGLESSPGALLGRRSVGLGSHPALEASRYRNLKYEAGPTVELVDIDEGAVYHPRELDLALPKVPDIPDRVPDRVHLEGIPAPRSLRAPSPQPGPYPNEFSRLSARAKNLISNGKRRRRRPVREPV